MSPETARAAFVLELRNAHAMERQSQELMKWQAVRLADYPDIEKRIRTHMEETDEQLRRHPGGELCEQERAGGEGAALPGPGPAGRSLEQIRPDQTRRLGRAAWAGGLGPGAYTRMQGMSVFSSIQ